jgi:hypothetical protein
MKHIGGRIDERVGDQNRDGCELLLVLLVVSILNRREYQSWTLIWNTIMDRGREFEVEPFSPGEKQRPQQHQIVM